MHDKIILLDLGSPNIQRGCSKLREMNVYCEIVPYNKFPANDAAVKGVILWNDPYKVVNKNVYQPYLSAISRKYPVFETPHEKFFGSDILNKFIKQCRIKKTWTAAALVDE